jgi:hypothetical protein
MDTVKVDVRKLQLLNDSLNTAQEALNQVRLSVHGFQPSYGQQNLGFQGAPIGFGATTAAPFAQGPQIPMPGIGIGAPYSAFPQAGISHSTPAFGWTPDIFAQQNPYIRANIEQSTIGRVNNAFPFAFSPIPLGIL